MPHVLPQVQPGDAVVEIFIKDGKAALRFSTPDGKLVFETTVFDSKDAAVDAIYAIRMYGTKTAVVDNAKELYPTDQYRRR